MFDHWPYFTARNGSEHYSNGHYKASLWSVLENVSWKCTHSAEFNGHTSCLIKSLITWQNHSILSLIAQCKTSVTSFLMSWSYIDFALSHTVYLCQSLSPIQIRLSRPIGDKTQLWPATNWGCQLCILAITGSHHHVIYEGTYNRSNDNSLMVVLRLSWWFNANSVGLENAW